MMIIPKLLAGLIPGRGTVYLLLAALASGFVSGYWVKAKFAAAQQLAAVNAARVQERDLSTAGMVTESRYLDDLDKLKGTADEKLRALRKRLASAADCSIPVPSEWVREPGRVPDASGPAGRDQAPPARVDPVAQCSAVVDTCEQNRLGPFQENARQLLACQEAYENARRIINR